MKKIYKIMVFILMIALVVGSAFVAPITLFATGTALVGATFAIKKMPKKGEVGETVKLPKATNVTAGSTVSVKVTDPYNKSVNVEENGDYYEFIPTVAGKYKVVYTASAVDGIASKTTSEVYTVIVKGDKVTLSFGSNSPFIMQDKIGADTKMVLPYPEITTTDVDGEKVTTAGDKATVKVTVKAPNVNTEWDENTVDEDFSNPLSTKTIDGKVYYIFTPSKTKGDEPALIAGQYEIIFTEIATGTRTSQKVQVSETYSVENQNIDFTWEGTTLIPESAELGTTVDLPRPVTFDKNAGKTSVKTFTVVEVEYVNGETKTKCQVDDFKFVPMDKAENDSYYKLTYKIYTLEQLNLANYSTLEDALENAQGLVKTYSFTKVKDTEAPTAVAVFYDNDEIVENDASYAIPTKSATSVLVGTDALSNPITIPAIYATDNYSEYGDLTLKRSIVDPNGTSYDLDGNEILNNNYDLDETKPMVVQAEIKENATVYLRKEGTYTLRYYAKDAAGNSATTEYKIVVANDLIDAVKPNITLPTIQETVDLGETITFADAKIKDYKNGTDGAIVDANMKTGTYFYYGKAESVADVEAKYNANELTKIEAVDSVYTIKVVKENPTANYITIVFRAEDDGANLGQEQNNVAYAYSVVSINSVVDNDIPEITTNLANVVTAMDGAYEQGEKVTLPNLEFTDNGKEEFLKSTLRIFDKNGKEITVSNFEYSYDEAKYAIKNGQFVTTTAGIYNVVVTVTDLANNILVNSFQFEVKDTEAPKMYIDDFDKNFEAGKTYTIPAATLTDDSEIVSNKIVFTKTQGLYEFNQGTRQFVAYTEGTYTFHYVAEDIGGNKTESRDITITVKSTVSPEFELDNSVVNLEETMAEKGVVSLPFAKAEYESDINIELTPVTVTVTGPNGVDVEVNELEDHYEFNATQNGKYTITYKTENTEINKSFEKSYTIKVGDLEAPTLMGTVIPGTFKIGDTLEIDLTSLTVKDNIDGETSGRTAYSNKLEIKIIDPEGEEFDLSKSDNILSYNFEKSGDYALKYTFSDAAGNQDDAIYSFKVNATSETSSVGEIAWGTALIVAAVALVAGVVVYFVRTRDKSVDKEKVNKKEEEK